MSELNDYNYINVNETIIPVNTIKYKKEHQRLENVKNIKVVIGKICISLV
jgi:hypothetical protein